MNTELIKRTTLTEMCNAWRTSADEIRQAFALLVAAEERLKLVFKPDSYLFDLSRERREYRNYEQPEALLAELKKDAWRAIIDRIELRRVLSIARNKELDSQLETGKDLPDIDEAQILAMLEGSANNVALYIEEMTKEVFDWLRPHHSDPYKTNVKFEQELGARVVIGWGCEHGYGRNGGFRINYHREANFKALDNVFHALDGQGTIKSHRGALVDAVNASPDGHGETKYFRFKCFKNHNVHLEFRRLDLLAKLNAVAGGLTLKEANKNQTTQKTP